jgi:glyoxalase superfamily protein
MSTPAFQVAIDCADPHSLVRFWAAVTGYEIEDHSSMVAELIESGHANRDDAVEVDGKLQWATASACRDPAGRGPRLLFQQVPEPKTVKDRIHLDLHFGEEQRDEQVERILALGATKLWDGQQGPYTWVTFADPEGHEFCVG